MNISNFLKDIFNSFIFLSFLKKLPDALLIVEEGGRISWLNDKSTTIFEGGRRLLKSYNFDDLIDCGMDKLEKSSSTRTPVIAGAFTPTGKEFFVEINAKKCRKSYIVTIRDITAMTNVLSNAEQTSEFNKEKNAMLVKLANEIKSPITSILGFSQAMIDGLGGEITEKQDKYVKIINKNSNDLYYFMDKFIEFAYAESTLYEYDYQIFDIVNSIQSVIRSNESAAMAKGLTVNFDYEELPKRAVYSDEKSLKIIVQNLLETSIKLTDTGSVSLKISYADEDLLKSLNVFDNVKENSMVHLIISDTGIGLQETEMSGLFEPYTQLDKSNKKNIVRSISLGTANVLAKRLHGIVWAESEVMKGTKFHVIVPIEKDFIVE